jgi:arylsulfatase
MSARLPDHEAVRHGTQPMGRQVLPIPDPRHVGVTTYDARDPATAFPPITPLRPPAGAPNVLVVLIDDAGFGSSSAFGGPINTPNFERLAAGGLRYTRFHTTALCSPTRQALLTGRNHHSVGMGGITEIATSAPGYSSIRPKDKAPIAETLKLNGYSTAQFGKCHEVPVWQSSPMGPFDAWPTGGGGFEHFYGFIGAETNQWAPAIYRDTVPVADAGQAVLRLLRSRCHARAASRAEGMGRPVRRQIRRRLGRAARGDRRPAAAGRGDSGGRRVDSPAGRGSCLG